MHHGTLVLVVGGLLTELHKQFVVMVPDAGFLSPNGLPGLIKRVGLSACQHESCVKIVHLGKFKAQS